MGRADPRTPRAEPPPCHHPQGHAQRTSQQRAGLSRKRASVVSSWKASFLEFAVWMLSQLRKGTPQGQSISNAEPNERSDAAAAGHDQTDGRKGDHLPDMYRQTPVLQLSSNHQVPTEQSCLIRQTCSAALEELLFLQLHF